MLNFLVLNQRVHDIYWQTLLILLTILIPVSIETFKFLSERFQKLGKAVFLYEVVKVDRFYTLIPFFSFMFIFALEGRMGDGELNMDPGLLVFFHTFLLFLWLVMFWYIFGMLVTSIKLLADSGDELNIKISNYLKDNSSYIGTDGSTEKWKIIWSTFSLIRDRWQSIFLSLFWKTLNYLVTLKKFNYISQLLNDFSKEFLSLGDEEAYKKTVWLNEKKRWLWFHEKKFSDGTENPYSVYVRLLELHSSFFLKREAWSANAANIVFESGLDQLYRTTRYIIESLTSDELSNSNDGFYGLFRQLEKHVAAYKEEEDERYKKYINSLPIYSSIFEHSENFELKEHAFPEKWQLSIKNIEDLLGSRGDALMRLVWLNHFLDWSHQRVDHGKRDFDRKLNGSVEMLFPKMYNPWLALWLGFRNLSWSGDRIDSLCQWERNFSFDSYVGESYWYDPNKSEEENEREMFAQNDALRLESKRNTARIMVRLQVFGKIEDIRNMKTTLQSLEGRYQSKRFAELNRLELLELVNFMLETV